MPFNGSGTYALPAGNPVVTGTTISSSTTNTTYSDIATALTNCLTRDGQSTPSANLPMNANKLTGLAAGTSAGDSVRYDEVQYVSGVAAIGTSGQVLTSNGSGAPSFQNVAVTAATQAEMEAATSNSVAASPLNTKWHPGVAKVWIKAAADGTSISASYNVTSITDDGTGSITVTIATDFSSANYAITTFGAGANSNLAQLNYITAQAAGSFSARCLNPNSTDKDPQFAWFFACFGDQ